MNEPDPAGHGSLIPAGARIVVRVREGQDQRTGRTTWRDYIGHVVDSTGGLLTLDRDPAANGSRPAQRVSIAFDSIAALKPIPERPRHGIRR